MAIYEVETQPTSSQTPSPGSPAYKVTSFCVVDPKLADSPIVFASEAFEKLTGYSTAEVTGKNCRFLQGSDTNQPGLVELRQAIRDRRACRVVLRNFKKDGTFFWNDFLLTPIFDSQGEVTLFIGVQNWVDQLSLLETGMNPTNVIEGSTPTLSRLGEILVSQGVVSRATALAAVQMQYDGSTLRLGEILVQHFGVPEYAIVQALSEQIDHARAQNSQTELLLKTVFAVRLAQTTMEAVPEMDLPIFSLTQPLSDAGGDTFYPLRLDDGSHLLLLADVAGHSVISSYAVAAFLGMCCALSNQFIAGEVPGLRELFMKLNHCLLHGPFADVPISAMAAHWDIKKGRLHIINAGMPHGFWFERADAPSKPVAVSGNPLGILPTPFMEERVLELRAGERVIFGSDGLFETLSTDDVMFQDLAAAHLDRLAGKPLGDTVAAFCNLSRVHSNENITDDVLAVAIEQPPIAPIAWGFRMHMPSTLDAIDTACDQLLAFLHSEPELQANAQDLEFVLLLAARESLSNAVLHGNSEDPSKSICFRCISEPPFVRLMMSITDEGTGFDFDQHIPPEDLQTSERGRGLPILRATVRYAHMIGGELQLQFDLGAQPEKNPNDPD